MTTNEMIAVLEAYKRGEKIECSWDDGKSWMECGIPLWDFSSCQYRIAKPAPKKVKLHAWFDGENFFYLKEGVKPTFDFSVRVPSEDKEIELP